MPIKAQWYYPNNLNKDPEFVTQHIEFLKSKIPSNAKMTTKKWDALKNDIKENITKYCKEKKKRDKDQHRKIHKKLNLLVDTSRESITPGTWLKDKIQKMKDKLETMYRANQEESSITFQAIRQELHGKPTKAYFSLERKLRIDNDRVVASMIDTHNKKHTSTRAILDKVAFPFYESLYKNKSHEHTQSDRQEGVRVCLDSINKFIPTSLHATLEADIKEGEITRAINKLAWHKAPGCDGLSINYYKLFQKQLSKPLEEMYI